VAGRRIEVEAKYEVAVQGAADRYLVAPDLGPFTPDGPVRSVRMEDHYIDTPDWALSRAGYAARIRRTGHTYEIGLKSVAAGGGKLQRREEIDGPADADLNPRNWPKSQARAKVIEVCGHYELAEILTVRQLRRVRDLRSDAGRAELSLDEVEVIAGGRSIDAFEVLEVELKKGDETALAALSDMLDDDEALRVVVSSKLERATNAARAAMASLPADLQQVWRNAPDNPFEGKAQAATRIEAAEPAAPAGEAPVEEPAQTEDPFLGTTAEGADPPRGIDPAATAPEKRTGPLTIGVVPEDSMPEAARKVLAFHFAKMQKREAGARSGTDAEDLHDMRVATRRLRAAWRVFDGAFKAGRTKKIRRHLETVADRLGAVRDLDVLIEGLADYSVGLNPDQRPGLEPLDSLWRRQRNAARAQLIAELDSPAYEAFISEMQLFLQAGANAAATVGSPTSPHRVRDQAASRVWAAYEGVRAYEQVLPWADVETLHDLRITTKWLRYTLEFLGETMGPDAALTLQRTVVLQDHLGALNDADVAAKLARDVLVARAGELSKAEADSIGAYLHSREREVARRRRALGPIWRAVNGAPFRRALGRATAAL
jgi:CHAD domain-containing protein/uncharacterized protein YjbK